MWINESIKCENISGYYYPDVLYYNPWLHYIILFGIVMLVAWLISYVFGVMKK